MNMNSRHFLIAALLFALGACGEAEEEPSGPLAKLTLELEGAIDPSVVAPHAGLIWAPYVDVDELEDVIIPTESMALPASLEKMQLSVFRGPSPDDILKHNGVRIAFGMIVAFDDRDGDGTFSLGPNGIEDPDLFFGVSLSDFLVFLEIPPNAELSDEIFVNPEAFEPGLSRARIDLCSGKMEFVPMAAPIVIETFEPTKSFAFFGEAAC